MEAYTGKEHARALDWLAADMEAGGPWTYKPGDRYVRTSRAVGGGMPICEPCGLSAEERNSNARMIAAAPDLAEACGKMERDIGELGRLTRAVDLKCHPDARNMVAALVAVIRLAEIHADAARAALAKAGVS